MSLDLQDHEKERLTAALRVADGALAKALESLALAAAEEWLDQILARRLPPRIKDAREIRLLHYALHVAGGQLPRPEQIGDLFHLTAPESRTLHRNTRTRYAFELDHGVLNALGEALESGTWVEASSGSTGYMRVHLDEALFEYAELRLSWRTDSPAPRITKDVNYDDYRVPLESVDVLCRLCGKVYDVILAAARERAKSSQ